MSWIWFVVVVAVFLGAIVVALRSFTRWPQTPPRDAETWEAEARLMSTRSMDQN